MPGAATPTTKIQWSSPCASARLAHADWLDAARDLQPSSIDLLYVDPPFNTGRTQTDRAGEFPDAWPTTADYILWLRERLEATLPLIKPTGSILLHIDWRVCHHARLLLDDLLTPDHFINHLIWSYGLGGSSPKRFARKHDDILFYAINPNQYWFNPPMVPATSRRMAGQLKKATDVINIPTLNNMAAERVGWPTQKPLKLLELLVGACCPPGGTVFDPCCGSGTTLVAASNLDRNAAGADIDERAIQVATKRLNEESSDCETQNPPARIRSNPGGNG